jgi:pimeloyl-ACP methyl ester carboxylesterase
METMNKIEHLDSGWVDPRPEKPAKYPPLLKWVQLGFKTLGRLFPRPASRLAYRLFSTPRFRARHGASDKVLETARIFEFMYGKQLLKAYEWGSGDQTILLIHGWESRGTAMRTFVPKLVEKGFRVVAFDGPAHGDSAGNRTNLPHFAGAIRAILNRVGEVHGVIAHSFGGASLIYAMRYLDTSIQVEKLVQIAVPSSMVKVYESAVHTMKVPKRAAQFFRKILESKAKRPLEDLSIDQASDKVHVGEALFVHDRKDRVVPYRSSEEMVNGWTNASLLATEGYGHFRLMKNPDVIDRVVDFVIS